MILSSRLVVSDVDVPHLDTGVLRLNRLFEIREVGAVEVKEIQMLGACHRPCSEVCEATFRSTGPDLHGHKG